MDNKYQYVIPEGTKYKISVREWSKMFGTRGRWPFVVCEAYVVEDRAVVHHVLSMWGLLFFIIMLPLVYLFGTVQQGFKETHRDYKRAIFDKKYGAFSSDVINAYRGTQWAKLSKLIRG